LDEWRCVSIPDLSSGSKPERDGGFAGRRMFATLLPTKRVGAKYLVLTHLIPMIGADCHGIWKIPGGALSEAEYRKVVQDSGFTGSTVFRCP